MQMKKFRVVLALEWTLRALIARYRRMSLKSTVNGTSTEHALSGR